MTDDLLAIEPQQTPYVRPRQRVGETRHLRRSRNRRRPIGRRPSAVTIERLCENVRDHRSIGGLGDAGDSHQKRHSCNAKEPAVARRATMAPGTQHRQDPRYERHTLAIRASSIPTAGSLAPAFMRSWAPRLRGRQTLTARIRGGCLPESAPTSPCPQEPGQLRVARSGLPLRPGALLARARLSLPELARGAPAP